VTDRAQLGWFPSKNSFPFEIPSHRHRRHGLPSSRSFRLQSFNFNPASALLVRHSHHDLTVSDDWSSWTSLGLRGAPGASLIHRPLLSFTSRTGCGPNVLPMTLHLAVSTSCAVLPWDSSLYSASSYRQRPTLGLPHPTVLRLQVFSTS
jgi:hypothetical protein